MKAEVTALIIGRKGSKGFPGKNTREILGRPMAYYPISAASLAVGNDKTFLSTDDDALKEIARTSGINVIDRPKELCTDEILGEDVFVSGYFAMKKIMPIDIIVLMFCNAPTITAGTILSGVDVLVNNPDYDSAVTVSRYNMWSPARARRISEAGLLQPFLPEVLTGASCDRDSQGDVWFADMGVSIVRTRCLENIGQGLLPQRWMGRKIYPLRQEGGLDVDYEWQIPMVEYWLREHGHE